MESDVIWQQYDVTYDVIWRQYDVTSDVGWRQYDVTSDSRHAVAVSRHTYVTSLPGLNRAAVVRRSSVSGCALSTVHSKCAVCTVQCAVCTVQLCSVRPRAAPEVGGSRVKPPTLWAVAVITRHTGTVYGAPGHTSEATARDTAHTPGTAAGAGT